MRLGPGQYWQVVASVDVGPAVADVVALPWRETNKGSTVPHKSPCWTVPPGAALSASVAGLIDRVEWMLGGETQRFVFRKLGPGQGMAPHVDRLLSEEYDWRRFQVPIVTDHRVVMRWPGAGVEVHLQPGLVYEVRVDELHEVVNGADIARIHLQIDQTGSVV